MSHPQRRDGGGIPDPSVLVLQVVSLGPLVPLTDLPQLHRLVYKHKLGRRNIVFFSPEFKNKYGETSNARTQQTHKIQRQTSNTQQTHKIYRKTSNTHTHTQAHQIYSSIMAWTCSRQRGGGLRGGSSNLSWTWDSCQIVRWMGSL